MHRTILAVMLAGACGTASAGMSTTITLASDYLFDGVSQTQGDRSSDFNPALQISLDYAWDNGFYVGTWASNVDFGDEDPADAEVDWYGGYGHSFDSGWGWSVGFAHYTYIGAPGSYEYTEYTGALTFPTGTTAQIWVADDDVLGGEAYRVKGKHAFDLGNDYSLALEATYTDYVDAGSDYFHGQVGVSRPLGPFTAYLGYSDTDQSDNPRADGRLLFTLSTTVDLF